MSVTETESLRDRIECMRLRPLLHGFLDDELDEEDRSRFAAHLEACRRCGLEMSVYRSLKDRLSRVAPTNDEAAVARLSDFVDHLFTESPDDV